VMGLKTYLQLGRDRSETTRDTKEESVVLSHLLSSHDRVVLLRWSSHLAENLLAQSLLDLVDVAGGSTFFDSLLDGFSKAGNVAVKAVVDDSNLGHGMNEKVMKLLVFKNYAILV
jgi:hypothetical protein